MTADLSSRRLARLCLIGTLATSLVFILLPGLDLLASSIPFDEARGVFPADSPVLRAIRNTGQVLLALAAGGLVLTVVIALIWPASRPLVPMDRTAFLLAVLIIGPGLLVNALFKEHWGRARPGQIEQFGGTAQFTRAWVPTDQCATNCSFVSGEGAGAAWSFAFAALFTGQRRRRALAAATAYTAVMAGMRIAMGGHFLSDTVLAVLMTGGIAFALHWWFYERHPDPGRGDRWAGQLARLRGG